MDERSATHCHPGVERGRRAALAVGFAVVMTGTAAVGPPSRSAAERGPLTLGPTTLVSYHADPDTSKRTSVVYERGGLLLFVARDRLLYGCLTRAERRRVHGHRVATYRLRRMNSGRLVAARKSEVIGVRGRRRGVRYGVGLRAESRDLPTAFKRLIGSLRALRKRYLKRGHVLSSGGPPPIPQRRSLARLLCN